MLNKNELARKIARHMCSFDVAPSLMDFDMGNLFPSRSPMENLEDAASGAYENLPRNTLRERSYGPRPLMIRPDYKGDFLEKLKDPPEGKIIESADPNNLWDFSMPSEWLKHQEEPNPRVLLDDFYEVSRPGGPVDQVLKDYWNRGWDSNEAPEMSEDTPLRWGPEIGEPCEAPFKSAREITAAYFHDLMAADPSIGPDIGVVIATYLLDRFPIDTILNFENVRVAKLLSDLEKALITTNKGTRKPNVAGVTALLKKAEPRSGRWTFSTTSHKTAPYTTVFQFIPQANMRDLSRLHVRVSCSCPSFLFWGAQYNAVMGDYLYGAIRPKFSPPKIRDPKGQFYVCKHVLACIPIVSKYLLGAIPSKLKEKIQKQPKFVIEKKHPGEELKIPKEYRPISRRDNIKKIVREWDEFPTRRKKMIMDLQDPEEVIYIAHRFPETATHFVADRLKQLAQKPELKKEALQFLKEVKEIEEEHPPVVIPAELKSFESDPSFEELLKDWDKKGQGIRRKVVMDLTDPDKIAFLAYKLPDNNELVSYVGEKLKMIIKDKDRVKGERDRAEKWLKQIF